MTSDLFKYPSDLDLVPGMSGGPVIDAAGILVAINSGAAKLGNEALENLTLLQPIIHVREILSNAGVECNSNRAAQSQNTQNGAEETDPAGALPQEVDTSDLITNRAAVDVVLVLDDSTSMQSEQLGFGRALVHAVEYLQNHGVDFRICLTTTDVKYYKGKHIPWGVYEGDSFTRTEEYIDVNTVDVSRKIAETFTFVGSGYSSDERAIAAVNLMTSHFVTNGCFRNGGRLLAIVLSDEDERSVGGYEGLSGQQYRPLEEADRPDVLDQRVREIFDNKRLVWNSIVVLPSDTDCEEQQDNEGESPYPSFQGRTYAGLSEVTGGFKMSICLIHADPDWFASDLVSNVFFASGFRLEDDCYALSSVEPSYGSFGEAYIPYFTKANQEADQIFAAGCDALLMLDEVGFNAAEEHFRNFANNYPDDPRAPQAVYWVGDMLMRQGEGDTAKAVFAYGAQRYPDAERTKDLLLRKAYLEIASGDLVDACESLRASNAIKVEGNSAAYLERLNLEAERADCDLPATSLPN